MRLTARTALEEELELPAVLEREGMQLYHSPLFKLPALLPLGCRALVMIHDAIPAVRPDLTQPGFAALFAGDAREAATNADAVVCPSMSAKADIVRALAVPQGKVHVIPEAPDAVFRPLEAPTIECARERHGLERPFVLVVGSVEPRKNPAAVLDALAELGPGGPFAVFVGPAAGFDLATEAARRGVSDRVRYLGLVPDEVLVELYNAALALVFPSFYEGFGLPILEAFACGTPVIASNAASIPEVAGDAAILFSPENAPALAGAIRAVVESPERRADLKRRGEARLKLFSREALKERLSDLYAMLEVDRR